jgi:hypothetical protein
MKFQDPHDHTFEYEHGGLWLTVTVRANTWAEAEVKAREELDRRALERGEKPPAQWKLRIPMNRILRHPGRTPEERRLLDMVGSGQRDRYALTSSASQRWVVKKLLADGLLVEAGDVFEMPVFVHIQWCDYWSERSKKES